MMMQYIHENYDRKLLLENIADQAMISKSTALNLFRSYLDDTLIHYLLRYRLQEAAKLLITTEKKKRSLPPFLPSRQIPSEPEIPTSDL